MYRYGTGTFLTIQNEVWLTCVCAKKIYHINIIFRYSHFACEGKRVTIWRIHFRNRGRLMQATCCTNFKGIIYVCILIWYWSYFSQWWIGTKRMNSQRCRSASLMQYVCQSTRWISYCYMLALILHKQLFWVSKTKHLLSMDNLVKHYVYTCWY